jgi:hypothetical protein
MSCFLNFRIWLPLPVSLLRLPSPKTKTMAPNKAKAKIRVPCVNFQHCGKSYVSERHLKNHERECAGRSPQKKTKIAGNLQKAVWETYIGSDRTSVTCFCCRKRTVTVFSNASHFQCGHIKSDKHGGKAEVANLLPICAECNNAMSSEHWDDYVHRHKYPLRVYGYPIQEKVARALPVLRRFIRSVPLRTKLRDRRALLRIRRWRQRKTQRSAHRWADRAMARLGHLFSTQAQ